MKSVIILTIALLLVGLARGSDKFSESCLAAHNKLRAAHGAPALKLSSSATAHAKQWAAQLASTGQFAHSTDQRGKLGENLAGLTTDGADCSGAVKMWYDEIKDYDFGKPGFNGKTGHFTQLVWKETTELGCAVAKGGKSGMDIVVCNYSPPGNMVMAGEFEKNVSPKN